MTTTALTGRLDPQFADEPRQLVPATPMGLLQLALEKEANIDVIERLAKLQREERDYQARVDFDTALNLCQSQIGRIAPNQKRENNIMWADYAQLDRAVRPIYVNAGFSIGFSEVEHSDPQRLRMKATLSARGISREYFADISRNPANSKMSQLDADAAAASRVKRYLMLDIFNIAIGIDKDEKIGLTPEQGDALQEMVDQMRQSATLEDGREAYKKAYKMARDTKNNQATLDVIDVWEKCQADFAKKGAK